MIGRPQMTEAQQIMRLFHRCTEHLRQQGIDQWNEYYPSAAIVQEDIHANTIFIYRQGSDIMGSVTLDGHQPEEYGQLCWEGGSNGSVLVIHRLAVDPEHQGKGIARQLMDYAEVYARDNGYSSIRLDCFSMNVKAASVYRNFDYQYRGDVIFDHSDIGFHCFEKVM